ncbi:MAG: hypothetical protein GY772_20590 [bacterium]|nr:hypothetical protein [bacterium]
MNNLGVVATDDDTSPSQPLAVSAVPCDEASVSGAEAHAPPATAGVGPLSGKDTTLGPGDAGDFAHGAPGAAGAEPPPWGAPCDACGGGGGALKPLAAAGLETQRLPGAGPATAGVRPPLATPSRCSPSTSLKGPGRDMAPPTREPTGSRASGSSTEWRRSENARARRVHRICAACKACK